MNELALFAGAAFMELLKNKTQWLAWKQDNIFGDDTAEEPKSFPCFVYKQVTNWNYQEIKAIYLCTDDIKQMQRLLFKALSQ